MNNKQHDLMLSGKMYNDLNQELIEARKRATILTNKYNGAYGEDIIRYHLLKELLGKLGDDVNFEPNFRCEFGYNIEIGDHFFANFDCVMLDGNKIIIGNNVLLGPRVGLYTANHAIYYKERVAGGCYAKPIEIKDNVWIGGGVQVMGGVTIGQNSIIGAGSVVTSNIPNDVIAGGIPCRVIRPITDNDITGFCLNESP